MKSIVQDHKPRRLSRPAIYFLLSLLAHIVICVLLFLFKDDDKPKKLPMFDKLKTLIQPQEKQAIFFKDPVSELPASLKPRQSNFGTLTHVDDVAQAEMPKQCPEEELGLIEKGDPEDQADTLFQETAQVAPEQAEPIPEPVKTEPEKSQASTEEKLKQVQEIEQQERRFAELSERVARGEEEVSILKKKPQVEQVHQQPGTEFRPKRKANIIAMTKGFIENLTHEGDDWLKRDGDDSKRPTLEEMKFFSYEQRINWQLQASWKHNFERMFDGSNQPLEGRVVVAFSIDEQGNVISSELVQSSGYQMLDKIVLQNVKAASPFPPIPKHFNTKVYNVGRCVRVYADRFGF